MHVDNHVWKAFSVNWILLFQVVGNFCQSFFKLKGKQNSRKCNSQDICNWFCHINRICLVSTENTGQNIDQRNNQYKFPDDGHNDGIFGSAKGDKRHLAGNLDSKHKYDLSLIHI